MRSRRVGFFAVRRLEVPVAVEPGAGAQLALAALRRSALKRPVRERQEPALGPALGPPRPEKAPEAWPPASSAAPGCSGRRCSCRSSDSTSSAGRTLGAR